MTQRTSDQEHPEAVRKILTQAGWHPNRDVSASLDIPHRSAAFPIALEVLVEFGGLRIGTDWVGIETVAYRVDVSPNLACQLQPWLDEDASRFGTRLFALAELGHGDGYLVIDEKGRTYFWIGDTEPFAHSLELLLLGKLPPQAISKRPGRNDVVN
ncbi:MAG TPA: SUKH-3 domain-containing protein [Pirellulales bacterium]